MCVCGGDEQGCLHEEACPFIGQNAWLKIFSVSLTKLVGKSTLSCHPYTWLFTFSAKFYTFHKAPLWSALTVNFSHSRIA